MSVHSNNCQENTFDDSSSSESPDFEPYAYGDDDSYLSPSNEYNARPKAIVTEPGLKVFTRSNGKKTVRVRAYETVGIPGRCIRHAITGTKTQYRFGTLDEDLFFSVSVATGENGCEPSFLFFDTPEEYERTFYVGISAEQKGKWVEKYQKREYYNENMKRSVGDVVVK